MSNVDRPRRVTQREVARLAGVSQTTVSIVLNDRTDETVRIPPETRERVLRVIRQTGYLADPVARRLVDRHNRILGVFTYEPVFPSGTADFYHPFLVGIEECAESLGCDLLLFTSAPAVAGRRRIYQPEGSRLRLADGCVLLGRQLDREDLRRLLAEGQPFVSVGRRDDAGAPVPYVGGRYADAVAALVHRARALGHRRLTYLGDGAGPESFADRWRGFTEAAPAGSPRRPVLAQGLGELVASLVADGVTAVFMEEYADGVELAEAARAQGLAVPADLSIVALGDPTRPAVTDLDLTGFRVPRREMGWRAVELLTSLIEGRSPEGRDVPARQQLLPCELVEGATLAPPPAQPTRTPRRS